MAVGFQQNIKPYFTECYQQHMSFMFDLWSAGDVENNWDLIYDAVQDGTMPAEGCPEGVWDSKQQQQFLNDFQAWKNGGFQP